MPQTLRAVLIFPWWSAGPKQNQYQTAQMKTLFENKPG
jgi:hypothetical protein